MKKLANPATLGLDTTHNATLLHFEMQAFAGVWICKYLLLEYNTTPTISNSLCASLRGLGLNPEISHQPCLSLCPGLHLITGTLLSQRSPGPDYITLTDCVCVRDVCFMYDFKCLYEWVFLHPRRKFSNQSMQLLFSKIYVGECVCVRDVNLSVGE